MPNKRFNIKKIQAPLYSTITIAVVTFVISRIQNIDILIYRVIDVLIHKLNNTDPVLLMLLACILTLIYFVLKQGIELIENNTKAFSENAIRLNDSINMNNNILEVNKKQCHEIQELSEAIKHCQYNNLKEWQEISNKVKKEKSK